VRAAGGLEGSWFVVEVGVESEGGEVLISEGCRKSWGRVFVVGQESLWNPSGFGRRGLNTCTRDDYINILIQILIFAEG
jgi:hypothetical protein